MPLQGWPVCGLTLREAQHDAADAILGLPSPPPAGWPEAGGCLGDHLFQSLLTNKKIEWSDYRRQVTDYELKRYLPIL